MRHTASGTHAYDHTPNHPQFTPGPWQRDGHRAIVARSADGLVYLLAEVWSGGSGIEAADANERLIAAAPSLFCALAEILEAAIAAGDGTFTVPAEAIEQARAALVLSVEGRA